MMEHPGLVRAVHDDYFAAGATVATTNTYAIHHDRLDGTGFEDRFAALHAAGAGRGAAARRGRRGRIAGSIGPLVASYRPEVHPPHDEAVAKYAEVARLLAPHVDLILCETVASLAHARAVLEGAKAAGKPVWLSVTVDDEDGSRLRSGEPVAEAAGSRRQAGPRRSSPTARRPRRCRPRSRR
jgi:S-methylmethionine-dependent homocysteine/selenocysteine methylase